MCALRLKNNNLEHLYALKLLLLQKIVLCIHAFCLNLASEMVVWPVFMLYSQRIEQNPNGRPSSLKAIEIVCAYVIYACAVTDVRPEIPTVGWDLLGLSHGISHV